MRSDPRALVALPLFLLLSCGGAEAPKPGADKEDPPATAPGAKEPPKQLLVDILAEEDKAASEDNPQTRLRLSVTQPGEPEEVNDLALVGGRCTRSVGEEGALVLQRCWWAGAGADIGIYREGDALIVRERLTDEGGEAPPAPKDLRRIPVPAGVEVKVK